MNEKKKLLIVLSFIIFIIAACTIMVIVENIKSKTIYNQFIEAYEKEGNTLVYIGRPTCSYCNLLDINMSDMKQRYDFEYIYINTDSFNNNYMNKVLEKLELTSTGTPYLAIVGDNKVIDRQNGFADYDKLFEFLQKNKIIKEDAELLLNYIGINEYEKILKSKDNNIVVVGQSTCRYCLNAKVILNEIVEEKGITINYLNITYLTTDEKKIFTDSFDYFKSNSWGTPVMMIVKNGKIVDMIEQLTTKDKYIEFFEKNGVLK